MKTITNEYTKKWIDEFKKNRPYNFLKIEDLKQGDFYFSIIFLGSDKLFNSINDIKLGISEYDFLNDTDDAFNIDLGAYKEYKDCMCYLEKIREIINRGHICR